MKTTTPIFTIVMTLTMLMSVVAEAHEDHESFSLISSEFMDGDSLPVRFTCEGEGISPPLSWSGLPEGAQSLVVIMDHMPSDNPRPDRANDQADMRSSPPPESSAPEGLRWYWGMYNIPVEIMGVTAGQSVGTLGNNVVNNRNEYSPPCSKGPGEKSYTFHIYALSTSLDMTQSDNVSEATLRKSMDGLVLGSDSLTVRFERSCQGKARDHSERKEQPKGVREPVSELPLCQ